MSEGNGKTVPNGWSLTTVGEIAQYINGAAFKPTDRTEDGVPIIRIQNLTDPEKAINRTHRKVDPRLLIRQGDLLFSWSATLDAFIWHSENAWLNQHIFKVEPEGGISNRFTFYLLRHTVREITRSEHMHGSTMQHINRGPFLSYRIVLPPLDEQVRIAEKLDELLSDLDAGVKTLEGVRAKLKQYRAAVLKAAVEGTLTAEWRAAHPDAEPADKLLERILLERRRRWEESQLQKFKDAGKQPLKGWKEKYDEPTSAITEQLPLLPESWCWTTLEGIITDGPQNGAYFPSKDYGTGTAIVRIDDYQNGWVREYGLLKLVAAPADEVETYALREGDLVINRVNSMTHLGKCLIVSRSHAGCLFESNMMRAKLTADVAQKWVEFYLHSLIGRSRLTQNAKWAVNQASINQEDVKRTPVPLPPFAEQSAIVEAVEIQLSVIDHLESDLEAKLKSAAALRQSILKSAFEGKLVPQDPNDEPASELLKRIAAERVERERLAKEAKAAAKTAAKTGSPRRGHKTNPTKK